MAIAGCFTNWKPQDVAPAQLLQSTGETEVQVRFAGGGRLVVRDPAIEGDSLVGWQVTTTSPGATDPVRRAFPLAEVKQLAIRGNNVAPNVILGAATGFAAFIASVVAVYIIVCSTSCD